MGNYMVYNAPGGQYRHLIQALAIILPLIGSVLDAPLPAFSSTVPHPPHILLLNSYHQGYKGTDDIVSGFRTVVEKAFPDATIKTEYLDSKYYSGVEYDEILQQLLSYKYKNITRKNVI